MPRRRKTQSGADAQDIPSTAGVRYGEGDDMQALQQNLPSPDTHGTVGASGGGSPMPAGPPVTGPPPVDPAAVQQFLASNNPGLLTGGTKRPEEPITAGMPMGPGPGPEVLRMERTPIARFYRQLADDTGNPKWRRLAERAGLT